MNGRYECPGCHEHFGRLPELAAHLRGEPECAWKAILAMAERGLRDECLELFALKEEDEEGLNEFGDRVGPAETAQGVILIAVLVCTVGGVLARLFA